MQENLANLRLAKMDHKPTISENAPQSTQTKKTNERRSQSAIDGEITFYRDQLLNPTAKANDLIVLQRIDEVAHESLAGSMLSGTENYKSFTQKKPP